MDSEESHEAGLEFISPMLVEIGRALGWVAAQALLFIYPLLEGWIDKSTLERAIRRLEELSPAHLPEDR